MDKSSIPQVYADFPVDKLDEVHASTTRINLERRCQPFEYRMHYLKQLGYLIQDNISAICQSVKDDLGRRPEETEFGEIWNSMREIELAVERLAEWMKDESGVRDTPLGFKLNNPRIKKQPKGVGLIISPWNYPWFLVLGPMTGAIAAGCPFVIKPSEHSKACSLLLAQLVPKYLDPEAHRVCLGAVSHSTNLLEKRWGHIFFVGSTNVGRIVATAAAKNLVSCTLELGGKSPAIIAEDADLDKSARRILSIKALGSGQMCTNTDYVLCPKHMVGKLMAALRGALNEFYPPGTDFEPGKTAHLSQMVHSGAYDRITRLIDSAKEAGCEIIGNQRDPERRRIGLTLVEFTSKDEASPLVNEELFGPILPIIAVENVDAAIAYVNAKPNPLALYVYSKKRATFEYVLDRTLSGGACWNDCSIQTMQRGVPFGGVGESGWGAGHGKAAFDEFTHRRSTIDVPFSMEPFMSLRYPGPGKKAVWGHKIFKFILGHDLTFARSTSIAGERRLIQRQKWLKRVKWVLLLVLLYSPLRYLGYA
ncbi:hypothetical protein NliqN6_1189 [Naganishia liquefaciens]|uniref:Aldehyde dehydrogenase n=1 Tax=Naganishia liquefaciens TaxID=104408 RepID=A0A8H3TPF6_9TREE|nr:hypothetical protein NliqN6_1189 [Naganishia liquefaciens]